jgi:serine/threonine protein kinase
MFQGKNFEAKEDFLLSHTCLNQGKYGKVFKGQHRKTNEILCFKKILLDRENEICMQRAQNEIDIHTFLSENFPHEVIQFHGFYEKSSKLVMVMELAFLDLFDYREKLPRKKMPRDKVVKCMKQICTFISHLHENNIMHGDLKLENILIMDVKNTEFKLCDFGVSKRLKSTDEILEILPLIGTADYMTPETVLFYQYGLCTDIWALGVICYELFTGKVPFSNHKEHVKYVFDPIGSDEIAQDFVAKIFVDRDQRPLIKDLLEHPFLK